MRGRRDEKEIIENGTEVIGYIVQANSVLYQPGLASNVAQVIVDFDADPDMIDSSMAGIAVRMGELKGKRPRSDDEADVADLVNDEAYRPFERHRLPKSFCDGERTLYSMHIWVMRSKLPDKRLQHPFIRMLVVREDPKSRGLMLDYREDDAVFMVEQ